MQPQYISLNIAVIDDLVAKEDAGTVVAIKIHICEENDRIEYRVLADDEKYWLTPAPAIKKALAFQGYAANVMFVTGKGLSDSGHMSGVEQVKALVAEAQLSVEEPQTIVAVEDDPEFLEERGHNSAAMDEEIDEDGGLDYWNQRTGGALVAAINSAGHAAVELRTSEQRQFDAERTLAGHLHTIAGAVPSSRARARVYTELKETLAEENTVEAAELLKVYESKNLPATLVRLAGLSDNILAHRPEGVKTARTVVEWFDQERQALAKLLAPAWIGAAAPLAVANTSVRTALHQLLSEGHAAPLERTMLMENMALPSFDAWYNSGEDAFELNGDGKIVLRTLENGLPIVEALYVSGRGDVGNELLKKVAQYAQDIAEQTARDAAEEAEDGEIEDDKVESVVEFANLSEEDQGGAVIEFLTGQLGIGGDDTINEDMLVQISNVLAWALDGVDHMIENQLTVKQVRAALVAGQVELKE